MDYNELFEYRDGKLYNKIHRNPRAPIGAEAGCLSSYDGYYKLGMNKKSVQLHRVIWEMHNGTIPNGLEIDHINRDRADNRIENLRAVTRSVNQHNKPGVGVHYSTRAKARPYVAFIKNNQKFKTIGSYGTYCGAVMARMMYKLQTITL